MTQAISNPTRSRGVVAALLWGCFLGSSWTWVIGMLFPMLLLRDFAAWGWVAFALPNVIGAAAMGFVLRTPEQSERLTAKHSTLCRFFSDWTIAFHIFVATWLLGDVLILPTGGGELTTMGHITIRLPWLILLVAFAGVCWRLAWPRRRVWVVAVAATAISLVCFAILAGREGAWSGVSLDFTYTRPGMGAKGLMMFLPACIAGFVLCPYLDLSFHRARRDTASRTGMGAFAFGFGVVFFLMIIFSLCYADTLARMLAGVRLAPGEGLWARLLPLHLSVQIGFTVAMHLYHRYSERPARLSIGSIALYLSALVLGLLAASGQVSLPEGAGLIGLTFPEAVYRTFLLLYGTAFPAYVWLCMIPTIRGVPLGRARGVWLVTLPFVVGLGFAAFVGGWSIGTPLAVALLGVARVVLELMPAGEQRSEVRD